ncbi:MAG: M48 family metallopeptidase [Hyphomicrobiales bacterium]|nr:M48 family metallopeptidase [Hyphomicrobiales bacterium]
MSQSPPDATKAVFARAQLYGDGADAPRRVDLRLGDTLQMFEQGAFRAAWAFADIRRVSRAPGALRIRALTAPPQAWCEISDPAFAAAIEQRCRLLAGDRQEKREARWRIAALATTGVVVIAALVWIVIPALADRLAPLVPVSVEKQIGAAADRQARARFKGGACVSSAGEAALARLVDRLKLLAGVPLDVQVGVLASPVQNAFALPGGRIYLLRGLIESARSPDELAGVLAHEFGHVAHRDSLRAAMKQGGAALAIGLVFGDMFGAGAIAVAARASLSAAYSREAETQADDFAARVLNEAGRPARALGDILKRIAADERSSPLDFLRDHPLTNARQDRLENESTQATGAPLMSAGDWLALRAICNR